MREERMKKIDSMKDLCTCYDCPHDKSDSKSNEPYFTSNKGHGYRFCEIEGGWIYRDMCFYHPNAANALLALNMANSFKEDQIMTNKIGEIINYGCYGGKAISIHHPPYSGNSSIELPECFNHVPAGFIAYIDKEGKIQVMEEDPEDYYDNPGE